ncbi:hypothetical protein GCM10010213_10370 [Microbacterium maritypicum]|uniref:Uncharacterized protein n=1 Tax=Microbacterium maritypicum TaxID=33918 RepID=A0A4Y4B2V1_MICMQ|nr:hypothetical protein MLI01_09900 [Microbacterium liquefaciens]GGV53310.1 hypothetical protein GCM10010213_10370 [Microbacterium liquefaciens]
MRSAEAIAAAVRLRAVLERGARRIEEVPSGAARIHDEAGSVETMQAEVGPGVKGFVAYRGRIFVRPRFGAG